MKDAWDRIEELKEYISNFYENIYEINIFPIDEEWITISLTSEGLMIEKKTNLSYFDNTEPYRIRGWLEFIEHELTLKKEMLKNETPGDYL